MTVNGNTKNTLAYFLIVQCNTVYRHTLWTKEGRAISSIFACLWEILTFDTMETLALIPKHIKNIIVLKMCIDDIFITWRKQGGNL